MLIRELFTILPKSKHSASYGKSAGKYPFFTSSNIVDSFVDEPDFDGEYLIIGDGGTGNSKYINGKFSVSDHNYVLSPRNNTNARAVNYFLKKDGYRTLNEGFKGIGIKNVSKSYIESIDYRFNSKFAESQIVANLDKINFAIDLEKQVLFELDSMIKSRFNEMFGNVIENPKGWVVKYLSEICDVRDGTHDSPKYLQNGYIFITSKNITNGSLDFDDIKYISYDDFCKIEKRSHVDNGDILMPMIGTIGGAVIVNKDREFAIKNVCLIKFLKNSTVTNLYIQNVLNSEEMIGHLQEIKKGGIQSFIGLNTIRNLKIPVPPIVLQKSFASFVKQVDKLKFNAVTITDNITIEIMNFCELFSQERTKSLLCYEKFLVQILVLDCL